MAENQDPSWRSYPGGPKKKAPPVGWKQDDPAAPTNRRAIRLFALTAAGLGVAGGLVYLIYFLLLPTRPGLVVVAPRPTNVALLNHPYDPLGYASAKALHAWAAGVSADAKANNLAVVPVGDAEPYWADELERWSADVGRNTKIDPVVIYVAGHGGVDAVGNPVVYTGRPAQPPADGPPAVPVAAMIDALTKNAAGKRKILILDAGRGHPDPLLGEVHREFAGAVKRKLSAAVAAAPNLMLVCGTSPDEEGWETPEYGMTALAYHLLRGLNGAADPDRRGKFGGKELYDHLAEAVEKWSTNNRPVPQKPMLLASDAAGASFAEKKIFTPTAAAAEPPQSAVPAPPAARWQAAQVLAGGTPAPWVYTPAAWRRHRELSARLDRAAAAGDTAAIATLTTALGIEEEAIVKGRGLAPKSAGYSLALPAAAGTPDNLAGVTRAVEAATLPTAAGTLADAAVAVTAQLKGANPPVEAHFLRMLDFYQTLLVKANVPAPPPGELWKPLVRTRLAADRAALGVPAVGHAYSERVWPVVSGSVTLGDAARRTADDAALAARTGDREPGREAESVHLPAADKHYDDARKAAAKLQAALGVRDRAIADAPFLARWLAEADPFGGFDPAALHKEAVGLLKDAHALGVVLDGLKKDDPVPAGLDDRAAAVQKRHRKLEDAAAAHADDVVSKSAAQQSRWRAARALGLLPAPVVSPERRAALARTAAAVSAGLLPANTKSDAPAGDETAKIGRRAGGFYAALAAPAWGRRPSPGRAAAAPAVIAAEATSVQAGPADAAHRATLTAAVAANLDDLDAAARKPLADPDRGDPADEEAAGRLAAPYDAVVARAEQAVVNRAARWAVVFDALAERAALDHWYNAAGQAYFARVVAKAFLGDADALRGQCGPRPPPPTPAYGRAKDLGAVDKLGLDGEGDGRPVRWTSEADRKIVLRLRPETYAVPGSPVVWWGSEQKDLLKVAATPPQLIDGTAAAAREIKIARGPGIENVEKATKVLVKAGGFFRGQVLEAPTEYDVNPRPDFVFSDVRRTDGAKIAIRGDIDPGYVGILIDYSGSMTFDVGPDDKRSRKDALVETLQKVFSKIPPAADVSLRLMIGNKFVTDIKSTRLFPTDDGGTFARQFEAAILPTLQKETPDGGTPLLPVMSQLLDDGKKSAGPKTILVLTDGADTSTFTDNADYKDPDKISDERRGRLLREFRADYRKRFENQDVTIHVILFAAGKEEKLATDMFKDVVENSPTNPGRVFVANSTKSFEDELEKALRPKPRLVSAVTGRTAPAPPPAGRTAVPPSGLPAMRVSEETREPLLWWWGNPGIAPDNYRLKFGRHEQAVGLGAGDRLLLRMLRDKGAVRYEREIYYAHLAAELKAESGDWHVSVPGYDYYNPNTHFVKITAAVEEKSSRMPAGTAPLGVVRPGFVWWELARLNPDGAERRSPGTVYAWNLENLPAPCWRVLAADGPDRRTDVPNRLRGWVATKPPETFGKPIVVPAANLTPAGYETTLDGGNVTARVTFESIVFYKEPNTQDNKEWRRRAADPNLPLTCVVVRVRDKKGRTFQARLPGYQKSEANDVEMAEHRYYYRDDDAAAGVFRPPMDGYTGVFKPISRESAVLIGELVVELFNVSDLLAAVPAAVNLPPPTTGGKHPAEVVTDGVYFVPEK